MLICLCPATVAAVMIHSLLWGPTAETVCCSAASSAQLIDFNALSDCSHDSCQASMTQRYRNRRKTNNLCHYSLSFLFFNLALRTTPMLSVMLVPCVPGSVKRYMTVRLCQRFWKQLHSIVPVKVTKPHLGALPRPVVCVCVSACARVSPVTMVTQALRLTSRLALALRSSNRKAINYKFKQVSVTSVVSTGLLVEA